MSDQAPENLALRDAPLSWLIDRIHRGIEAVEAWVGASYTTVFVLLVGIPLVMGAIVCPFEDEFGPRWAVVLWIAATLWCLLDVPLTLKTWQCVRRGVRPLAPHVTRRLKPWPGLLRVIQVAWFLAHFGIAAWFAHFTMEIAPPAMQQQRTVA